MNTRSRVLLVDDEPINIRMLDSILRDDYDITVATSGVQALNRASADPLPDLILLDIHMDGMDGYEVCEKLKEQNLTRTIPIIFITSLADEDDERKGLELGAVDYIMKPYRPEIIKARMRNHLELKHKRDLLDRLCSEDPLTGIANRRKLDAFLQYEWQRAARYVDHLAVIFMDIDYFKKYNDHYGHVAGDECLQQIADVLQGALHRPTDLLVRYGGEEFVCVLPSTDLAGARVVAETLRYAVIDRAIPNTCSEHHCITLSFGVVARDPKQVQWQSPGEFLDAADRKLYEAKKQGRNCIVI